MDRPLKAARTWLLSHMTPNPVTVGPESTLDEALAKIEQYGFRHLPVVERNRVVGILSDRDLRLATSLLPARARQHTSGGQPERVAEIMHAEVFCLACDDSPATAAAAMVEHRIGAIPIVDGRDLLGIVTETDLLHAFIDLCLLNRGACDDLVRDHMHKPLLTVGPHATIQGALDALDEAGHLGVLQDGALVGILSERDLFLGLARERIGGGMAPGVGDSRQPAGKTLLSVSQVMTPDVLTTEPGARLSDCARTMIGYHVSALPVLEDGHALGIVTQRNVLDYHASITPE